MSKITETLADYVRRTRLAKGLSLKGVERQSARGGPKIAGGYVNRIENGQSTNPTPDRLKALSRGLGVPEEELFAIARGVVPKEGSQAKETELLNYFRELDPEEQRFIVVTTKALHRERSHAKRKRTA